MYSAAFGYSSVGPTMQNAKPCVIVAGPALPTRLARSRRQPATADWSTTVLTTYIRSESDSV
jgi:hypothetical protein